MIGRLGCGINENLLGFHFIFKYSFIFVKVSNRDRFHRIYYPN
jgi:hypothetical protein